MDLGILKTGRRKKEKRKKRYKGHFFWNWEYLNRNKNLHFFML